MAKYHNYIYDKHALLTKIEEEIIFDETEYIDNNLSNIESISYSVLDDFQSAELLQILYGEDNTINKIPNDLYSEICIHIGGDDNDLMNYYIKPCFVCRTTKLNNGVEKDEIILLSKDPSLITNVLIDYLIKKLQERNPDSIRDIVEQAVTKSISAIFDKEITSILQPKTELQAEEIPQTKEATYKSKMNIFSRKK